MKKIFYIILAIFLFAGCTKLLDKKPMSAVSEDFITFTESEMKLLTNSFYTALGGYTRDQYGCGIFWEDNASDNMISRTFNYNSQLAGVIVVPATGGGWDWGNIRSINYVLEKFRTVNSPESIETLNHYRGEFLFWRAWFYFDLLKQFGDLPIVDKTFTTESPELYDKRRPRNEVVDFILADLTEAATILRSSAASTNQRISKEVALLFKSRVALYEGSWEKHHHGTVFAAPGADPAKYFRACVDAVKELIGTGGHSIAGGSNAGSDYFNLFNKKDYSVNSEILLWKRFDIKSGLKHFAQTYMQERGGNTGLTKYLVESYLCTDGQPISLSPLYRGDDSVALLVQNRDPRLSQTMYVPGHIRQIRGTEIFYFTLPELTQEGAFGNTSGYQLYKSLDPDFGERDAASTGSIVFRYAEALLNYAEAAEELGQCTQDVLDATINKLRARVGMPSLTVAVGFVDPAWDFPGLSPLLNEIRRERRVELACEGYRFDDLMRWSATHLIKRPMLGARFSQYENKVFNPPIAGNVLVSNGYIAPFSASPAAAGWQFDPQKHYLKPLPTNEITTNPQLTQNPNY